MLNFLAAIGSAPGGGGGPFESIATATGTGSSGTITFSSIPSTYQHLQIRYSSRTSRTGVALEGFFVRFNSDSGNNYAYHLLYGNGTSIDATVNAASAANALPGWTTTNEGLADSMGVGIIDIHDYASTTKNKTLRAISGYDYNNSGSVPGRISLASSLWMNTSAINSISIITAAGFNWNTTSTFALYGIKGA